MGTAIGIDVRDPDVLRPALEPVFDWLRSVDERFSPYKPDSEVCRIDRGELRIEDASPDLRTVVDACEQMRSVLDGSLVRRDLDLPPWTPLEDGLKATADFFRSRKKA